MNNSAVREKLLAEYQLAVLEAMRLGQQLRDSTTEGSEAIQVASQAAASAASRRDAIEAELTRIDGIPERG